MFIRRPFRFWYRSAPRGIIKSYLSVFAVFVLPRPRPLTSLEFPSPWSRSSSRFVLWPSFGSKARDTSYSAHPRCSQWFLRFLPLCVSFLLKSWSPSHLVSFWFWLPNYQQFLLSQKWYFPWSCIYPATFNQIFWSIHWYAILYSFFHFRSLSLQFPLSSPIAYQLMMSSLLYFTARGEYLLLFFQSFGSKVGSFADWKSCCFRPFLKGCEVATIKNDCGNAFLCRFSVGSTANARWAVSVLMEGYRCRLCSFFNIWSFYYIFWSSYDLYVDWYARSSEPEAFWTVNKGSIEQFMHDFVVFILGDYNFFPASMRNWQFFRISSCILECDSDFRGQTEVNTWRTTAEL